MRNFRYLRADSARDAIMSVQADRATPAVASGQQFLAGGTTLIDLMKLDVMRPETLIDINPLSSLPGIGQIEVTDNVLRMGALVRMTDAAGNADVVEHAPVIVDTLQLAASQQLRNMATLGGNLLQRTRCQYFRDVSWTQCNKRDPGSGCAARGGVNRNHAVLGTSEQCIATYPGDFAQALMVLDAHVELTGPSGSRSIPVADLHRQPVDTPHIETVLKPGELITLIAVPLTELGRRSKYVKVRDRQSYEFALASAAVALALDGDRVSDVRIALGGLATVPWRAREAEAALKDQLLSEDTVQAAAEVAFAKAEAAGDNRFKIPLGKATLARALFETAGMEI